MIAKKTQEKIKYTVFICDYTFNIMSILRFRQDFAEGNKVNDFDGSHADFLHMTALTDHSREQPAPAVNVSLRSVHQRTQVELN